METSLKVLMTSSDRKLLEEGSMVSERMKDYGNLVEELHIVLLCDKAHTKKLPAKTGGSANTYGGKISDNVWIYPTNSFFKFMRPFDAARIGKKLVFGRKFVRGKSLITAQDPFECGWAGLKVKRKWRLPLEVQMHTDPFSPYFSGFLNFIRKMIAKKVLRHADTLRVVSESIKNLLHTSYSILPTTISVLPIYVDKEKIENGKISFDLHARYGWHFIMLTVSRLAPEKNLSLALETLAVVRTKFPNTGLIIVGSGPEERKLKSLVKKLKLESAVIFAGWQDNLTSFYKTSNVFIQTSLFEGYGLALVEAGLSGLPVITTPVGIALELQHSKDAYIYPPQAELFAAGVIDLMENNQKRENLRMNMKRALEQKLLSKADYMAKIKDNWEKTAKKVKS